jgi:SAM-dependent methyltransferase
MKDYYDALYKENEHYWGRKPSPLSLLLLAHKRRGRLLDLGAGQGPDTIYFAEKGFKVTAIDTSSVAINHLKKHAQEAGLSQQIDAREQDMQTPPMDAFDVIFSRMALQMISPEKRRSYIDQLKVQYPDAVHAHIIPIQGACFGSTFICENSLLKDAYRDWIILFSEDSWTISRKENKNKEPFLMREARIIAVRESPGVTSKKHGARDASPNQP